MDLSYFCWAPDDMVVLLLWDMLDQTFALLNSALTLKNDVCPHWETQVEAETRECGSLHSLAAILWGQWQADILSLFTFFVSLSLVALLLWLRPTEVHVVECMYSIYPLSSKWLVLLYQDLVAHWKRFAAPQAWRHSGEALDANNTGLNIKNLSSTK